MAKPNPNTEKQRELLYEKLQDIRAKKSDEESKQALNEAVELLLTTSLILPVASNPEIQAGNPDLPEGEDKKVPKLSPFTVTNQKGFQLFPFFTSVDLMQKFFDFPVQTFLNVDLNEYLPLLKNAKGVSGMVINPSDQGSYPFPTSFLDALYQRSITPQAEQTKTEAAPKAKPEATPKTAKSKTEEDFDHPEKLQKVLADFRKIQDQDSYLKAAAALMNSAVFVPVYPPEENQKPAPDQKQQLKPMLVSGKGKDEKLFVFFTDYKQLTDFTKNAPVMPLKMKFQDLIPMLESTMKTLRGFVIDPLGVNLVFETRFIQQFKEAYGNHSGLQMKESGDLLENLREPKEHNQELEAALITGGFHIPEIRTMYLKEHMDSKTGNTGWFVLVESDKHDPELFSQLAKTLGKTAGNREVGFMFVNRQQAQHYAKDSVPIYSRM
ncbi:enhanced serine sensitivity protein SseB C-terminal domain-containing protein [Erysipelotrichaceae bacterium 51-3]